MLVRDRMTSPAVTVSADTPFQEALKLMHERHFRRIPIVNEQGRLIGIVSERDLLHAAPSPATSLSVWEVNYLLWKLKISDVMTENVVTVHGDMPIEDAAQIMITRKIGGLPVVDAANNVVGVITETDVFRAFTELLGAGEAGLRIVVRVPDRPGVLAKLAQAIFELGGAIHSVGTFDCKSDQTCMMMLKITGVDQGALSERLASIGDEVVDARVV